MALIQAAKSAKTFVAKRLDMWKFANYCDRRFRGDVRYDPQAVTRGFLARIDYSDDDSELLGRICDAYTKAVDPERFAGCPPLESWQQNRQQSLEPFRQALATRNVSAVRQMYRNFYRDPCSSGLLAPPNGMSKAFFGGEIKDVYRRFYLGHVLCRLDYWKELTADRFAIRDLAGPGIGNPFGALVEGTHISVGAEYAHYCAHRISDVLGPKNKATVAELAGGFGGMAYYLLRDRPGTTYVGFDAPDRIALAAYYLLKAFPKLSFLLYGEDNLSKQVLARTDVALLPDFSLAGMPSGSVDLVFSSHSMPKTRSETTAEYLSFIDRMTRNFFFCIEDQNTSGLISDLIGQRVGSFTLADTRSSGWRSRKVSGAGAGSARHLGDSVAYEQLYIRPHGRTASEDAP
jgi:hypothetical protein